MSARSLGCSPDFFTQPDLRVRVLVDGEAVLTTPLATDQKEPLFAQAVRTTSALPFALAVELEETEQSGLAGERRLACDVTIGETTRHQTQITSADARTIVARGDGANAAEVVLVAGRGAPEAPRLSVSSLREDRVAISWDPFDASVRHTLAWGGAGPVIASVTKGDPTIPMTGLCDSTSYTVRVVRESGPWRVSSDDLTFRTRTAATGAADVGWAGVPRDARSIEIFAGPPGFVAQTSSFVHVVGATPGYAPDSGSRTFAVPEGAAEVRVVVTDSEGLAATSASFAFNAPPNPAPPPPSCAPPRAILGTVAPNAQPGPGTPTGAVPGAMVTGSDDGGATLPAWA